jgi:hypothetical protein
MDPETRRLLEETHALARDNNQMLRAIRRHQWLSFFSNIIFWILMIVLPLYLYQAYLQPEISKFLSSYGVSAGPGQLNLPSSADVQKLINSYKAGN